MEADYPESRTIKSFKLKGHQKPVTCLDHSSNLPSSSVTSNNTPFVSASCLLSGSEDETARLWDLRDKLRACLCIKTSGEVLSVAFGPKWLDDDTSSSISDGQATSASTPFSRDYSVYLSVGNSVFGYDLRKAASPILVEPSIDISLESEDEVNQISFSRARHGTRTDLYLAAADDAGAVRVTDCIMGGVGGSRGASPRKRVLVHTTTNNNITPDQHQVCIPMVTTAVFRPHSKAPLLASGGTDCTIRLWDVTKHRKPVCERAMESLQSGASQVCNPPFINHLAWSPSGLLLAAALGDGSIALLSSDHRSLVLSERLEEAHTGPVASVVFPEWSGSCDAASSSPALACHDRLLCSAGNDGVVMLWDLGPTLCGTKATEPASFLMLILEEEGDESAALKDLQLVDRPKTLFAWNHGAKPNWMVSSRGCDPFFPSTLFVADTTNEITAYTVPLNG